MEKKKKSKIIFDVVNSVKGGSGKSTFSLLLASYYAAKQHTFAYIIDLDLRGTSWEKNYGSYLEKRGVEDKFIYINDLMNDFDKYKDRDIFVKFTTKFEGIAQLQDPVSFYLFMEEPSVGEEIDEVKADLFENAIFRIIDQIYTKHSQFSVSENEGEQNGDSEHPSEEIHIVLDMPPSYEQHAERILRRLLTDVESKLYKKAAKNRRGKYESFEQYVVNLYMISAISPAHIELNVGYIKNFFMKRGYSSAVSELIRSRHFWIRFIGNDVSAVIDSLQLPDSGKNAFENVAKVIKSELANIDLYGENFWEVAAAFPVLGHMTFISSKSYFDPHDQSSGDLVLVPGLLYNTIEKIVETGPGLSENAEK